ncbi:YlaF family protein [Bacillus songklensis]|uniref:YlaF family protein n=1 Tax=Bacillus songklensis TaxID=1069116 RepID=A0ABV8B4Y0_9BACI
MKEIKWIFLVYSILAATSIMSIGVFIGEQSLIGIIVSIIVLFIIMGLGFSTKKKRRERGEL